MSDKKHQNSAEDVPVFPYQVLWAGYGNTDVTLRELAQNAEEYRILNETAPFFDKIIATIAQDQVEAVLAQHEISADTAHSFWLVCAFYLAKKQSEALGLDPRRSREALENAVKAARAFSNAMGAIGPKVSAAINYKRPVVAEAHGPQGPSFIVLERELHDFILVAEDTAADLAAAD